MVLGLTGGYCSGKNEVAAFLEQRGFIVIDLDRLGHLALQSCASEVATLLGPEVLDANGHPIRRAIGAKVFADERKLAAFDAIVQPAMFALLETELERAVASERPACINAAILYKTPYADRCDLIVEVTAPLVCRLARGRRRDGLSFWRMVDRIRSQHSMLALRARYGGKIVKIRNSGSRLMLITALERALSAHIRIQIA